MSGALGVQPLIDCESPKRAAYNRPVEGENRRIGIGRPWQLNTAGGAIARIARIVVPVTVIGAAGLCAVSGVAPELLRWAFSAEGFWGLLGLGSGAVAMGIIEARSAAQPAGRYAAAAGITIVSALMTGGAVAFVLINALVPQSAWPGLSGGLFRVGITIAGAGAGCYASTIAAFLAGVGTPSRWTETPRHELRRVSNIGLCVGLGMAIALVGATLLHTSGSDVLRSLAEVGFGWSAPLVAARAFHRVREGRLTSAAPGGDRGM